METRRIYMPITLGPDSARLELEYSQKADGVDVLELVRQVRDILLAANLTPLQAQAVLVRAWAQVQTTGMISPLRLASQDQEPSHQIPTR